MSEGTYRLRLALAQLDLVVGDIAGNAARIGEALERSRNAQADLVLFPELALCGYPPEDLLLQPGFAARMREALDELIPATRGLTAIVGFADRREDLHNAAAVLHDGQLAGVCHKAFLPNYAVFDEDRYFAPGDTPLLFERPLDASGARVCFGVSVCEDIWYPAGPPEAQAAAGAELLLNISASPYQQGKLAGRERMLATRATDNVALVAFCNLVGGQDELVFDGASVVLDGRGEVLARARAFEEDLLLVDVDVADVFRQRLRDPRRRKSAGGPSAAARIRRVALAPIERPAARPAIVPGRSDLPGPEEEVYGALVLATRDYVRKNGFERVVLGLSGGVDSALVATVAADALGPSNVIGVSMPSRHTSRASRRDAAEVARRLGLRVETISIEPVYEAYLQSLREAFAGTEPGVAEENLQSRARGNVLMALSNKHGWLVLTTGNKSETAVGYTTLYGDMAGGFAVIKDVPKGWVYRLCRWRNRARGEVIPESVLTRPPSAELRPDQLDSDTLPEYDVLDAILAAYVERGYSAGEIAALGHDRQVVERVIGLVDRNEYKRRQAAPGPKVTSRAFGKDRRLPITNRWGG
jgi:NAD+ synthase (glutamine-hydrolysing)